VTAVSANVRVILGELTAVADALESTAADDLVDAIRSADRVFLAGQGRSGLIARAFAMRLMHVGIESHVVGASSTPAIGSGDLLIAASGSGATDTTQRQLAKAAAAGSKVALITAKAGAGLQGLTVFLPARTVVPTDQHAGSLFEQSCLLLFDAIAMTLQRERGLSDAALDARHANLQ